MACSVFRGSRCISSILKSSRAVSAAEIASKAFTLPVITCAQTPQYQPHRHSSFRSSPPIRDLDQYPEVEVLRNPPEWKYVERLFQAPTVPVPPIEGQQFASGWTPQRKYDPQTDIYFIRRTKNHMIPVYLKQTHRGQRQVTVVRNILGDIWKLEKDLRKVVEASRRGVICATQVNEMTGQIRFHGDYVEVLKNHLQDKGF